MARRRHSAVQRLLALLSIAYGHVTARLPLPVARGLGGFLGLAAYCLVPRVRRVALENLDLAYGDALTAAEKRRIARGAAKSVGIVASEFSRIPTLDDAACRRLVVIEGTENLDRERGGFLLGAHLGNWEWMATVISGLGFKTAEVVRPLDDPVLNAYVERIRRARGVHTIDKEGAGPEIMRLLREGWVVGVLADQSPRTSAVPVTFFGQPCWATIAPAMVACRMRLPIYVMTMTRGPRGRYTAKISPPIRLDVPGDLRDRLLAITQHCQDILEAEIRSCPDQWLWLHRRWKRRPRLEAEWRERSKRRETDSAPMTNQQTPDLL